MKVHVWCDGQRYAAGYVGNVLFLGRWSWWNRFRMWLIQRLARGLEAVPIPLERVCDEQKC